jgi:hypothetical protein
LSMGDLTFTKRWSFNERFEMMDRKMYKKAETIKGRFSANFYSNRNSKANKKSITYTSSFASGNIKNDGKILFYLFVLMG